MLSYIALLVALSAATGPPVAHTPPGAQTRPALVCGAITRSRLEVIVGRRLASEGVEYSKHISACDYSAADLAVSIRLQVLEGPLNLAAELQTLQVTFPEARLREVDGLTGRAFALEIPGAGTQIHVLRGENEYLMVSVLGLAGATHNYASALRIARIVLAR